MDDFLSNLSSAMATFTFFYSTATFVFIYAMFRDHFPQHLQDDIQKYGRKLVNFAYPYSQITFDEFTGKYMRRSEAFTAIENYLSDKSVVSAKRLKADAVKDGQSLVLSMDYHEEVADEFNGIKVWWSSNRTTPRSFQFSVYPAVDEKRYYKLTFHNRHKQIITESYLASVMNEGKAIGQNNRLRKLYTNNPSKDWNGFNPKWSYVAFEHPASFDTLAMDANKKQEIINDINKFKMGRDYYQSIGKAWKRGYLLYGPPGTGKSTMIAAMANHLEYDVYDLELTAIKDNTELRRLLIDTSGKSILVIEDIDCSLDLMGERESKKRKIKEDSDMDPISKKVKKEMEETTDGKVTLSGVLNCVDGLWSSCGGERIIIFTTNYIENLDPALIRRGRMDLLIEMPFCCFEAFKVLAKNYLKINSHKLFKQIGELLGKTNMTPADVAENLIPKFEGENVELRLNRLIEALKATKNGGACRPNQKRKRRNSNLTNKKKK
ncbi:hypothetical protein Golob_020455 [Gossypium lobatum]|uniref:AAA+ ATPase domain-containing protein n=1 Tax=Gossypium lobatum TaxID=34289 RepID=A0A7J8LAV5_9ROSI|nr:hypothetical protein [Gossypium lobatum]